MAYADCDDHAKIDEQGFLSPFQYDDTLTQAVANSMARHHKIEAVINDMS